MTRHDLYGLVCVGMLFFGATNDALRPATPPPVQPATCGCCERVPGKAYPAFDIKRATAQARAVYDNPPPGGGCWWVWDQENQEWLPYPLFGWGCPSGMICYPPPDPPQNDIFEWTACQPT